MSPSPRVVRLCDTAVEATARRVVARHLQAAGQLVTYMKLRDGSWGLRCLGFVPRPGDKVSVTKKDGQTKTEVVGKVLWKGSDRDTGLSLAFATIDVAEQAPSGGSGYVRDSPRKRRPGERYECPDCGEYVTPGTDCWETGLRH